MSLFADESTILKNYDRFMQYIEADSRAELLKNMYNDFEEELTTAPASGVSYFHNAFPGGYIDHVVRVVETSLKIASIYKDTGGDINFTKQELIFAAMHHDLGKLGNPEEGPYYLDQESDWHRKNGKYYSQNENIQYFKVPDRSLFLLQKYNIIITRNEWLGIKLSDGVYDDGSKSYLLNSSRYPMKTNLPYIIHWADHISSRVENDKTKFTL